MHPDDIAKTAFSTHLELYEWNMMPFGLCNVRAMFGKTMTDMLAGLQRKICLVYLNDVIVVGRTLEECHS